MTVPDIFVHGTSGNLLNLRSIHPSEIEVRAIAHTLSQKNRWDARTVRPWSVLQHSLFLTVLVPAKLARQALSHDFVEGFIPDFPFPLKEAYPELGKLERHVWAQVREALQLEEISGEVWHADTAVRDVEFERLFPQPIGSAPSRPHPYFDFLLYRTPGEVRSIFWEKWKRTA